MRDLELLAQEHFKLCHAESPRHRAELIIWYADVGVAVEGQNVQYHCPVCGKIVHSTVDEFVHHETRWGLTCPECRAKSESRPGGTD
ncbi:MAG: hypothetical protein FJ039_01325 [Chloroflexi bacterium]|nr:hypothetical protein [Chloroflexota bacterium]